MKDNKAKLKIRLGTIEDAETLAPLAVKIFNDAFAANPLNKPEDMHAYIAEALSFEQFKSELGDAETTFYIAEIGSMMIGYAKLQEHSTEDCVADENPIELQRLYVDCSFHGKGVAVELMNECFDVARRKNYRTMWLGVWEHNRRAQKFYEKIGFARVGEHIFQLGLDAQTDWVMEKKL